jgi:two-component system, NarL family, sensor histidine kinase UhpB
MGYETASTSQPSHALVRLLQDEELIQYSIQDDGAGFESALSTKAGNKNPHGMGLAGMRERVEGIGGTFEIFSAPEAGTKNFLVHSKGESL